MKINEAEKVLDRLNAKYVRVHKKYEALFWKFYMGDKSLASAFNIATKELDAFRSDRKVTKEIERLHDKASGGIKKRLGWWKKFFTIYQTPEDLVPLKDKIIQLESEIQQKRDTRKEGYIDPKTKKNVAASTNKMATMMATDDNEKIRKACFEAIEKISVDLVDEYVKLVRLRNEFAKRLGYEDFYDYKLRTVEGMTKKDVFEIFEDIFEKTKYTFKDIRKMEKKMPGLRKPWNFRYMTSGDFVKEEDQYFQFDRALDYWGKSFSAMGISYRGGKLQLDLIDREGKYNNGFCHYQDIVQFKNSKWLPGSADFTCNVVVGQIGSGINGLNTLFHEGAHAADRLNSRQKETILNTEYPPASVAWAETHSQFCDTIIGSVEWRMRYAKNKKGESYPFDLYEKKIRKLHKFSPLGMMGIIFVCEFEKIIYEMEDITKEKVLKVAREMHDKYFDRGVDSYLALYIPHIYSWDTSAYYHGYGLSQLAVFQWRDYFYKKYGYIVDNQNVGKEMTRVWEMGPSRNFLEFVKLATGKKLTSEAFLKLVTKSEEEVLGIAKNRIKKLSEVPEWRTPVKLDAKILMVHGKKLICTNKTSFEDMSEKYSEWLEEQRVLG